MNKIHFIGILGTGMSSLALYCHESGYFVSGSDVKDTHDPSLPSWLDSKCYINKLNHNFINQADCIVYSTAISNDHPELVYAKEQKKNILHRSELIYLISADKHVISIAGTHGKTTTSAFTAWIFNKNHLNPSFLIGGTPTNLSSAKYNKGNHIILEADESDGSFLNYRTDTCVITNIEPDHLENHDNSFESYLNSFKYFIEGCQTCIYNSHDKYTSSLVKDIKNTTFYSFGHSQDVDFRIIHIKPNDSTQTIKIQTPDQKKYQFETQLQGTYNAENAVSAWIVGYLNNINYENLTKSTKTFEGVKRRCEIIGHININNNAKIPILDDYGHHPTECHAVIKELKRQNKNIIHIFQPHRYSRLTNFFDEFCNTLKESDILLIQDVFTAGENKENRKDTFDLINKIKKYHPNIFHAKDTQTIVSIVNKFIDNNSIILFQGAGSVSQTAHECANLWKQS